MSFRQCARLVVGLLAVVIALAGGQAFAATETYGYDALGRLIRWVDSQGRTTEYAYDAVGNLLSVTVAAGGTQNPAVTSVSPDSLRRGDTKQVTITGTNLANVTVTTSHAGLTFSNLATSATQVTFSLSARRPRTHPLPCCRDCPPSPWFPCRSRCRRTTRRATSR
jgi:YD repeat-containing protein